MTIARPAAGFDRFRGYPTVGSGNLGRVTEFLALGDGIVRQLSDVLLRLDGLQAVLDDSAATPGQRNTASRDVRALVSGLEAEIRSRNTAMLDITAGWPMAALA
ncbi:hypothetical protein [Nocardia terpenica]|uniref:Uncharacterized protein n=1 Tax=Nocardia terpenica TaxID=455432 RepID=A0A291RRC5_9NOCA|nr:hypothetical protein [Nocardia terpenica]ATL70161.1 hypothetical protein CRH09_32220 [Nocardia terpenica]